MALREKRSDGVEDGLLSEGDDDDADDDIEMDDVDDGEESEDDCPICMCDMGDDFFIAKDKKEMTRTLDCGHRFHASCIHEWLKNHEYCPTCRSEVIDVCVPVLASPPRPRPNRGGLFGLGMFNSPLRRRSPARPLANRPPLRPQSPRIYERFNDPLASPPRKIIKRSPQKVKRKLLKGKSWKSDAVKFDFDPRKHC